ncbi:MAG: hypothetical protein EBS53_14850 [Bacteroidetes bacterium]|nr:hypothetical protein [Bacteroidota bacterium]
MAVEVLESEESEAVRVCEPEVLRAMEKVPTPLVRAAEGGRLAAGSLEVMETVPLYPVAVFPAASLAVTVKSKDAPAVAEEGMEERTRELAEAELTMMFEEVMEMAPSEAVRV